MTNRPSLEELERRAENRPERIDVRALCEHLDSDDYERNRGATEVRETVIENATDLSPVVESLREVLTGETTPSVRVVGETLSRVVRANPDELAPLVAADLDAAAVDCRGVALDVIGRAGSGVVRPYLDEFAEHLDEADERVAALALAGLSTVAEDFPETVAEYVPLVHPYLADEWIPDDGGGLRACYSRTDDEGDVATGEPSGARLTNKVVRPYAEALSLLHSVALTNPTAVEPVLPRIEVLVTDPPDGARLTTLLEALTRVARANPAAVESAVPAVERHAESDRSGVRVAARNLLSELGRPVERPDPISVPESMAVRDRPVRDGDDELTAGLDERAVRGDVDVETVLPLLRCEDPDVRDHVAWGLECGVGTAVVDDVHDRATSFLSLLDEPHDCTRKHLLGLLGGTARRYPERWTPALAGLADHDDPVVRRGAVGLLGTDAYPALAREHLSVVDRRLDDDDVDVRANAISVLAAMAKAYPEVVAEYATTLTTALDDDRTRLSALKALRNLAGVAPAAATPATDAVTSLIAALAGPEAIDDRAQWGRKSHTGDVGEADHALKYALSVGFWLAKNDAASFAPVRSHAERIAEGRYWGHDEARKLLVELNASTRN